MMKEYRLVNINRFNDDIDALYSELLEKKEQFIFISCDNIKYALTKEKSLIPIKNTESFLNIFKDDIYYKTVIKNDVININKKDLQLYNYYIQKFKKQLTEKKYNDKYYFGCVAVKTNNGFITTIRGKQNLNEYTIVENVDHNNHTISVINKKATLNAPLLDYLFKNNRVKAIVHLHDGFNNKLPFYDYAIPGTAKDSVRNNTVSFNIMYHGIVYLLDKKGNIL